MKPQVNSISHRLSLRPPQRRSLELLDEVLSLIKLEKNADPAAALEVLKARFPTVTSFERDFPSLCFALATGVGKTRLMGAFVSYLYNAHGIRHFFVLAPNLTIYNKLIADFTPNTPKYVFRGIAEFAANPPEIITGDNYESGRGVRSEAAIQGRFFDTGEVHINIFNISKINSEVRGGNSPRIKRLAEYIGESYFKYLSTLPDLVLLMDESHRYRGSAGVKAISELKPILGLELTATPQTEKAKGAHLFQNVIYSYPLPEALNDGFVKEPAVVTRKNFNPAGYNPDALEKLKLDDGIRVHEHTKTQLAVYAHQNSVPVVKPFMLVVAQDTTHAAALAEYMTSDGFYDGQYKGRVIQVHSNQTGEERDETVQQLLQVENPANPTEVVIHVNMLKEGWDVTNLYTIVPLRAANSRTLVEQSIGRGLRLPYGRRTGNPDVDRLSVVSHDRFDEIVKAANDPNSYIRKGIIIGQDIPEEATKPVTVQSLFDQIASGRTAEQPDGAPASPTRPVQAPLFQTDDERRVVDLTRRLIRDQEALRRTGDLQTPEVVQAMAETIAAALRPQQAAIEGVAPPPPVSPERAVELIERTIQLHNQLIIPIPRITIVPSADVTSGYNWFDLSCAAIHLQPVDEEILIRELHSRQSYTLTGLEGTAQELRLEDFLIRALVDFDDISYDQQADLLYHLAGQLVAHLRGYLASDTQIRNVLIYHNKTLADLIHAQMQPHYFERATSYTVTVSKNFQTLRDNSYSVAANEALRDFRNPVEERLLIRGMLFGGFAKSLYARQKFDSDAERRFAVLLEDDPKVGKWVKPGAKFFQIEYRPAKDYEPDFVVETETVRFLCEPKRSDLLTDPEVQDKARAAATWCANATKVSDKPWHYLLIPDNAINLNATLAGLATAYTITAPTVTGGSAA